MLFLCVVHRARGQVSFCLLFVHPLDSWIVPDEAPPAVHSLQSRGACCIAAFMKDILAYSEILEIISRLLLRLVVANYPCLLCLNATFRL